MYMPNSNFPDINKGQRLHLLPSIRLPLVALTAGLFGFLNGARIGFTTASGQFFVENLHRVPSTKSGWHLYHKRKNVVMVKTALSSGFKGALKLSAISCSYFGVEALLDYARGEIDFINTLLTTVAFGWMYCRGYKLNSFNTQRVMVQGAMIGLGSGILQDLMIWSRDYEDIWYARAVDRYLLGNRKPFAAE